MNFNLSDHAKEQLEDKDIPTEMVLEVVKNPEQKYNTEIDENHLSIKGDFWRKDLFVASFCKFH